MELEPGSPLYEWMYAHAHWVVSGFVSVLSNDRRPDREIKFGHLEEYGVAF